MGHFTITLPGNRHADVRWGTIRKIFLFTHFFRPNSTRGQEMKGYTVMFLPPGKKEAAYRLLKINGEWTARDPGRFGVTPVDKLCLEIRAAIDEYEKGLENKH